MRYFISIDNIELDSFYLSINPPFIDLTKSSLAILINDSLFSEYTLTPENIFGTLYSIHPYNDFNIYSSLSICINDNIRTSNLVTLNFSQYFYNHNSVFQSLIHDVESGTYRLSIDSLNGDSFNVQLPYNIIICNGIDRILSDCTPEKYNYIPLELISLHLNLFDSTSSKVPDGKYLIKLKIEEI